MLEEKILYQNIKIRLFNIYPHEHIAKSRNSTKVFWGNVASGEGKRGRGNAFAEQIFWTATKKVQIIH